MRTLRTPGCRIALEDTDPYRDCHPSEPAPRLTDAEAARWQREFRAAWREIEREHPDHVPALAAGLSTLTPLAAGPDSSEAGGAARQAFGAVAASPSADPGALALRLIQEFQHAKLGAILDLYDLYDPADERLLHAPWGKGKRQVEGLLQGAYGHLAVTDFPRARREFALGVTAGDAGGGSAQRHARAAEAIDTLLDSGLLTPLGTQFVQEMRYSVGTSARPADGGHPV